MNIIFFFIFNDHLVPDFKCKQKDIHVLPDGDTLSDARDIDCSPIIAAIEKADALVDSFRFGVNGLISVSLFSSAIMIKFSHFPINPNGS